MDNEGYAGGLEKAAGYIAECINESMCGKGEGHCFKPKVAVVLGSGLGAFADGITGGGSLMYAQIPGIAQAAVKGHEGKLIWGYMGDSGVIAMKGRLHYYEGHDMGQVVAGVRILRLLGAEDIIITNAAGGIREDLEVGDLMLITDHIGLFCESPLRGPNIEKLGTRFPDMTEAYSVDFGNLAERAADAAGIKLKKGVYGYAKGPMYETPAEIKALKIMGADAVGMSTVPEVIAARHAGMKVLGISCITNTAAGMAGGRLNHEEVIRNAGKTEAVFIRLITGIIRGMKG